MILSRNSTRTSRAGTAVEGVVKEEIMVDGVATGAGADVGRGGAEAVVDVVHETRVRGRMIKRTWEKIY